MAYKKKWSRPKHRQEPRAYKDDFTLSKIVQEVFLLVLVGQRRM